jgi:hypothetical protein
MTLSLVGLSGITRVNLAITDATAQGVYINRSTDVMLRSSVIHDCKGRGIGDFGTGTDLLDLVVVNNGHDGQPYNGDGILLQGSGSEVGWCVIAGNGDSPDYEHGIYVASTARDVLIHDCILTANSCSGVKLAGTGSITNCRISGSPIGLVFDGDQPDSVLAQGLDISASKYAIQVDANARLARFHSDYNTFAAGSRFNNKGKVTDLAGWQKATGLDTHSVLR